MHLVTSHSFGVDSIIYAGQQVYTTAIIASNVVQQIVLQEDVDARREMDRCCVSGCSVVLWKQREYLLFQAMQ